MNYTSLPTLYLFFFSSSSRHLATPTSCSHSSRDFDDDNDHGWVRVAVRLQQRNAKDLLSDANFADCVELQLEPKRLKLRKQNRTKLLEF